MEKVRPAKNVDAALAVRPFCKANTADVLQVTMMAAMKRMMSL